MKTKKAMEMKFIVVLIILMVLLIAAGALYYMLSGEAESIIEKLLRIF